MSYFLKLFKFCLTIHLCFQRYVHEICHHLIIFILLQSIYDNGPYKAYTTHNKYLNIIIG